MSAPTEPERLARVALACAAEPGDPRIGLLTHRFGGVGLLERLEAEQVDSDVLKDLQERLDEVDATRELELGARLGARFVIPGDDEWPSQIDDLGTAGHVQARGGPPLGLWARGPMRLDELAGSVAMVGSRVTTSYGEEVTRQIGAGLAVARRPVVSGLAFGIDVHAHRGALAGDGRTAAVLACGVDRAYPDAHAALHDHLVRHHLVLSEAPLGAAPMRMRFLARNRLIAALARGTVVVEAAIRSGALNTANWTARLSRPLMGVPGPVTSVSSEGIHELIRSGAATLVTRAGDVLELVSASGTHVAEVRRAPAEPPDRLRPRERQVLDAVPVSTPAGPESIARACGIALLDVQHTLLRLGRHGLVRESERGWRLADGRSG